MSNKQSQLNSFINCRAKHFASSLIGVVGLSTTVTFARVEAIGQDFETRCAQPGVLRCVGFDSPVDLGGIDGDVSGTFGGDERNREIDFAQKASGEGSLRMTIPAGQLGGSAGQYFTNFSDDRS
ncbi:MAG: hypothetical protein ACR2RL_11550, partial [Gammaproteobacteria bacterium]